MEIKSLVDQSMEVLNALGEYQPPQWAIPVSEKVYEKMKLKTMSTCSNIPPPIQDVSCDQTYKSVLVSKKWTQASLLAMDNKPVAVVQDMSYGGRSAGKMKSVYVASMHASTIAKQVFVGDTLMEAKTIYNFRNKSKQQIQDILMQVQDEFLAAHPDYKYDNWKYEDGKYGERTIMLIFKRK